MDLFIVASVFLLQIINMFSVNGQNSPVFIGQNTPPVQPSQTGTTNTFTVPNSFQGLANARRMNPPAMFLGNQLPVTQLEPWAPGEPRWMFPSSREQWMNSCQRLGCQGIGSHCVFWGSLCPTSVRRVPCRCQIGCRVDTLFIPFGQTRVMDGCNNICTCRSRGGIASCTARRC